MKAEMSEQDRRTQAVSDFRETLQEWQTAAEAGSVPGGCEEGSGREVLCVDRRVRLRVVLAVGGPTEGFSIEFSDGEVCGGEYFTTAPDYGHSLGGVIVPLMIEEAEQVAGLLGLKAD